MSEDTSSAEDSASSLAGLIDSAFHKGPAMRANQLIHDVRKQYRSEYGRAFNYEVSLLDRAQAWDYLRDVVHPRFSHYLRAKGFSERHAGPVFVSLFSGDMLYFIRAEQFIEQIARSRRLDAALPGADSDPSPEQVGGSTSMALLPAPVKKRRRRGQRADD